MPMLRMTPAEVDRLRAATASPTSADHKPALVADRVRVKLRQLDGVALALVANSPTVAAMLHSFNAMAAEYGTLVELRERLATFDAGSPLGDAQRAEIIDEIRRKAVDCLLAGRLNELVLVLYPNVDDGLSAGIDAALAASSGSAEIELDAPAKITSIVSSLNEIGAAFNAGMRTLLGLHKRAKTCADILANCRNPAPAAAAECDIFAALVVKDMLQHFVYLLGLLEVAADRRARLAAVLVGMIQDRG